MRRSVDADFRRLFVFADVLCAEQRNAVEFRRVRKRLLREAAFFWREQSFAYADVVEHSNPEMPFQNGVVVVAADKELLHFCGCGKRGAFERIDALAVKEENPFAACHLPCEMMPFADFKFACELFCLSIIVVAPVVGKEPVVRNLDGQNFAWMVEETRNRHHSVVARIVRPEIAADGQRFAAKAFWQFDRVVLVSCAIYGVADNAPLETFAVQKHRFCAHRNAFNAVA